MLVSISLVLCIVLLTCWVEPVDDLLVVITGGGSCVFFIGENDLVERTRDGGVDRCCTPRVGRASGLLLF